MKNQGRKIAPISFSLLYQWQVKGRTGRTHIHPGLVSRTSRER